MFAMFVMLLILIVDRNLFALLYNDMVLEMRTDIVLSIPHSATSLTRREIDLSLLFTHTLLQFRLRYSVLFVKFAAGYL